MGWLFYDWRLKILAILVAIGLWSVVAYTANPTTTREYTVNIDHSALPPGLVVLGALPTRQLVLVAPSDVFRGFDPHSLHVYADLSRVHVGPNRIPLSIQVPAGITLQNPGGAIVVDVDRLGTVDRQVSVNQVNNPPQGYHVVSISTNVNKVTVIGPQSLLFGTQAVININVANQEAPFQGAYPVSILDSSHNPLSGLTVDPAQASVKVQIEPDSITETKPVGWSIVGQPAAGYRVTSVTVTPSFVTVTGLEAALVGLAQVAADPVNITGTTGDVVETVRLRPPAGSTASVHTVVVHVFISRVPQPNPTATASASARTSPTPTPSPTTP
jgi:YbbR domain-containing protein